jgi:hypothetical protein
MSKLRVQRFSNKEELCLCLSEEDVPEYGWAAVPKGSLREVLTDGNSTGKPAVTMESTVEWAEGTTEIEFPSEATEVFFNGSFVGDAEALEVAPVDGRSFVELLWAPVPSEE